MSNNRKPRPQMALPTPPPPDQSEAMGKLAGLFKSKPEAYTPVTKSLKDIGLEPIIMDVFLIDHPGTELVECLVIPVQDLIYREWRHITQSELVTQPQNERQEYNDEPDPEVAGKDHPEV